MSDSAKLDSIKKRIRGLMNMTVESGATESEALTAMDKASKLMAEYDLSISDVEGHVAGLAMGWRVWQNCGMGTQKRRVWPDSIHMWGQALKMFDCEGLTGWPHFKIFGTADDSASALALCQRLELTLQHELANAKAKFAQLSDTHGRTARAAFIRGFTDRVNLRIYTLQQERIKADNRGSKALVVIQGQEVARRFQDAIADKKTTTMKRQAPKTHSDDAYHAGASAGENAALGTDAKISETKKIGNYS